MSKKIIWLTWEIQRRNAGIADAINADLYVFNLVGYPRVVKYVIGVYKTIRLLSNEKPDTLIVQNPSAMLAIAAIAFRSFFRYRLGVDTHNSGFGLETNSLLRRSIAVFIQKHAEFVIAHNGPLKKLVEPLGGKVIALPDRIPVIPNHTVKVVSSKHSVLFICRYNDDEPYQEVFAAAGDLPEDIIVFVTGNPRKKIDPLQVPDNVRLLGWVPWDLYNAYLQQVDVVMDLTTRENCLLCGGYEAVAVGKPLITSKTQVLCNHFRRGTVHTRNTHAEIAHAIIEALERRDELTAEMAAFKPELIADWEKDKDDLVTLL